MYLYVLARWGLRLNRSSKNYPRLSAAKYVAIGSGRVSVVIVTARLHQRIAPLVRDMDEAVAEASAVEGQIRGVLRINTLGIAARQIIEPRLGRFHRAHPGVMLDIVIDDTLSDIVSGRFDAGIRVGGRLEKDMIAVRLTPDIRMIAVASPDYLARPGIPRSPADLCAPRLHQLASSE